MPYEAMLAETTCIRGYNNDEIEAYVARPLGPGPYGGVVVIHHGPGWDEWTREVVNKFARHGYVAVSPHLYHRFGPGSPEDAAAKARAEGNVSDDQAMGDVEAAMRFLRRLPYANGRVGVIGFCSGGRQTYLAACRVKGFDAAVDCWGGQVVATPEQLTPKRPVAPVDLTASLSCPLLGIFGEEDRSPTVADVAKHEEALKRHGKSYEFHMYKGAGHGFFATDRANYRVEQANDGWTKVFAFYEKHLKTPVT
jgi:carboxymethylenebutenolidase